MQRSMKVQWSMKVQRSMKMSRARTCERPKYTADSLEELRAARAAAAEQSAGERGLRGCAEGYEACAGRCPHGPPAAVPGRLWACQNRGQRD